MGIQIEVTEAILKKLRELKQVMLTSKFVKCHVFVGCSLLFVTDSNGPTAGVFLIDFAKITPVPKGIKIDHVSSWHPGNHEDGLFFGMDNVIRCWEEVLQIISNSHD